MINSQTDTNSHRKKETADRHKRMEKRNKEEERRKYVLEVN